MKYLQQNHGSKILSFRTKPAYFDNENISGVFSWGNSIYKSVLIFEVYSNKSNTKKTSTNFDFENVTFWISRELVVWSELNQFTEKTN